MKSPPYKTIEHTADIGIEVVSENLPDLFRQTALAFFDLLVGLNSIDLREPVTITVEAADLEELMVSWLGELLYLFDTDGWLFGDFQLELKDTKITATAIGEVFDPQKHQVQYYIKAVTYHMLEIRREKDHWIARIIFDI